MVVWQEPEIDGVARIWARRLFGSDARLRDAGQRDELQRRADRQTTPKRRAWRSRDSARPRSPTASRVGPGSPLPGPRIFLNILPDGESASGAEFLGAIVADTEVPGGSGATIGPPSIDIDERREPALLYDADGEPRVVEGNDQGCSTGTLIARAPVRRAGTGGGERDEPRRRRGLGMAERRRRTGARRSRVREDFPGGAVQTGLLSGGGGGEVGELSVGRSGLGDGLVGLPPGPDRRRGDRRGEVSAPPAQFRSYTLPNGWIKPVAGGRSPGPGAAAPTGR